jgi:hypothetical protein
MAKEIISESKLREIISEEAARFKKKLTLEAEKKKLLKRLHEMYTEEVLMEDDSILALLPPEDQEIAKKEMGSTSESPISEGVGGAILDKLKGIVTNLVGKMDSEKIESLTQELKPEFEGKGYMEIYRMLKNRAKTALSENNNKSDGKEKIAKIASIVGNSAGAAGVLSYLGSAVLSQIANTSAGLPQILGTSVTIGFFALAVIAGIVWVLTSKGEEGKYKPRS